MSLHHNYHSHGTCIPVYLVGGRNLAFEGLRILLIKNEIDVAGTATTASQLDLPSDLTTRRFLVIFDITDETGMMSSDIEALRHRFPHVHIIVLLGRFQKSVALLPNDLRVNAVLDRDIACEALMKTLRVVLAGYGVMSPVSELDAGSRDLSATASRSLDKPTGLSDRETEIISCIAEGHSNKVIARRFSISEATVKIHVRGILRKVEARNRTQAAIWAVQKGFGSPSAPLAI